MEQTEPKDLFDTGISDSGKLYIRKFAAIARIAIFAGILITLIHIAQVTIHETIVNRGIYSRDPILLLEHNVLPYYTALHAILLFLQLYYYWKLSRLLTLAGRSGNEQPLNDSFAALYHFAVYGMIIFILALVFSLLDFYLTVRLHLN
jgi:hypothetical protein